MMNTNMEKACFCCTVCSGFWNNGGECRGEVCKCENPDECNEQKACYRSLTEEDYHENDH